MLMMNSQVCKTNSEMLSSSQIILQLLHWSSSQIILQLLHCSFSLVWHCVWTCKALKICSLLVVTYLNMNLTPSVLEQ